MESDATVAAPFFTPLPGAVWAEAADGCAAARPADAPACATRWSWARQHFLYLRVLPHGREHSAVPLG